jgi:hypothetical protein
LLEKWTKNLGSKTFIVVLIATVLICFRIIHESTWVWIVGLWIAGEKGKTIMSIHKGVG